MSDFITSFPSIIDAASRTPLGLLSLIILVSGALTYLLFNDANEKTRTNIFEFTTLISVILFIIAIQTTPLVKPWNSSPAEIPSSSPSSSKLPPCNVVLFGPCSE